MASSSAIIKSLRRFGESSAANKKEMEGWRDKAIRDMALNGGGMVSSASANGASFSLSLDGMTNAEWVTALDQALQMIELGLKSASISYGAIY